MAIRLNCDMGESFGIWKMGNDEEIMPYIDMANLACGFHASDAVTMNRSVLLAKKYDYYSPRFSVVRVGWCYGT